MSTHSGGQRELPSAYSWHLGDWTKRAACAKAEPKWFDDPEPYDNMRLAVIAMENAVAICVDCPVRPQCLEAAKKHRLVGIWGGHHFTGYGQTNGRHIDLVARLGDSAWWQRLASYRVSEQRKRKGQRSA